MPAHTGRYAAACCVRRSHIATVGYVTAASLLIGAQEVRTHDLGFIFRDERMMTTREPIIQSLVTRHVTWQSICLAGADDGLQNTPDRILVLPGCGPYFEHLFERTRYRGSV